MPDVALRRPRVLTGLAVLALSLLTAGILLARQPAPRPAAPPDESIPEAADLVVPGPLTTGQEERIGRLDGVDLVYGRTRAVTRGITVSADPGSGPFATTTLRGGRYPLGPGQIAVTPRTAGRLGLRIGSTLTGTSLTVVGTAVGRQDAGLQAYAPQTTVTALRRDDRIDRVDVLLRPGADPETVRRRIDTLLGPRAPAVARRKV